MNKKAIGFILLFFVGCFCSLAQENSHFDSIVNALTQSKNDSIKIKKLIETSWLYKYEEADKALMLGKQAESLAHQLNYNALDAKIYLTIGVCLYYKQEYVKSFEYYFKALPIAEKNKDSLVIVDCLINIGNSHLAQGNVNSAKSYYFRALKYAKKGNDNYIDVLNNLGTAFEEMGSFEQSEKYYRKAIEASKENNDLYMLSILLNNLGGYYTKEGNYTKAYDCFMQALQTVSKFNDIEIVANIYSGIAVLYNTMGNYNNSLKYYKKALSIIKDKSDLKLTANIYEEMSLVSVKKGNYKDAYKYLLLHKNITDSIFTIEKSKQIAEMNAKYETTKKDLQINTLKTEYSLKEAIAKKQKWIIAISILAVLVFIILSSSLIHNIRKKNTAYTILQDKNDLILKQNEEIEKQKKELENYTTELEQENILAQFETLKNQVNPHFLFNSLGVLSSLIKKDADQAYLFTKEFAKIYRVVLELKEHTLIYLSEELDFTESYLFLQKIRFSSNLIVNINIPDDYFYYTVPPFSLQLLVENAVKHNIISEQKPLEITIYIEDDFLVVRNTIQLRANKNISTGIGNKNLIDRYKILSDKLPIFYADEVYYYAKIPLLKGDI